MQHRRTRLVIAGALALVVLAGAVLGFVLPTQMAGATGWAVVCAAVLFGLGGAVRRVLVAELAIGEQLAAGTCAWLAISGALLALNIASRIPLLVIAAVGVVGAGLEIRERVRQPRPPSDDADRGPWLAFLLVLSLFLLLNLLGMLGTRGNAADDQAAYTGFVKRVLDCGDLIEPFSFRRVSAYGGQTMLHALAALRGEVGTLDLLDRGIFQWIAVISTIELARRRGLGFAMSSTITIVLVSLFDMQLNSGPIWSSYTLFLAAYGFSTRLDLPVRARLILALACLGATCTLRQNFLVPAGLFGVFLVLGHLRERTRERSLAAAWREERVTVVLAIAAAAIVVVPYMIATLRSSGTALYPIMRGTGSPDAPLRPAGNTPLDELAFFISIICIPEPIRVWWLLVPVMLIARDPRPLKPFSAYALACGIGFVALLHSFMLSDAWNLWRYAFGFLTPLAIILTIEVAVQLPFLGRSVEPSDSRTGRLGVPVAAAFLVWLALVVNMIEGRQNTARRFNNMLQNLTAAASIDPSSVEPRLATYAAMQRSVPEGATLATLLDDTWQLDYARNRIVNLDVPGFAAPAPGLPSFTTPDHWRAYFASQGIRYVAFIDPDRSSYLFRRALWTQRMFRDDEIFQYMSAHMVDTLDTLRNFVRTASVLFDRDGLYVLDLGETAARETDRGPALPLRMDAFVRRFSETEYHNKAWMLASRSVLRFKADAYGLPPLWLPEVDVRETIDRDVPAELAGLPHRWLTSRTRLRVLGTGDETVHARLWIRLARAYAVPTITLVVDGVAVASVTPDASGFATVDAPATCTGWCDAYILFNDPFDWWTGARENAVAQLLELTWSGR